MHKVDFSTKFQFGPIFAAVTLLVEISLKFLVLIMTPVIKIYILCVNLKNLATLYVRQETLMIYPLHETIDICLNYAFSSSDFL